jgi:Ca2+:H+ antiporter
MTKRILTAGLALSPVVIALHFGTDLSETVLFVLAAAALIPLAWLIGEATEHAAHHTGPGVGGFLNASFGNAPELIIALLAVHGGLTDVVRGSLIGSVIGNLLLVLGFSLFFGGKGELDRTSSLVSLSIVGLAAVLFLIPAIPSWTGDPDRHSLAVLSLPVAIALFAIYLVVTWIALKRHRSLHTSDEPAEMEAWSLRTSLLVLGGATVVTALVAEVLVKSVESFAHRAHLSEFFVAIVIIAIVGNAAEHGGAVVVAARGKLKLAAEIALSSSAQVAVFLVPAVALLSWAIKPFALSFRPIELAALGGATVFTAVTIHPGRSSRLRGALLVGGFVVLAVVFVLVGNR